VVINLVEAGKLRAVSELPLSIPETLRKGEIVDSYELQRPFAGSDRIWLARKGDRRWTLKFAPREARDHEAIREQFVKEAWNAGRVRGEWFVEAFTPSPSRLCICRSRIACPRTRQSHMGTSASTSSRSPGVITSAR